MSAAYTQLIFIDPTVSDRDLLIKDIPKHIKAVFLEADSDAISQITTILQQYKNLDALHIVTHGAPGQLIFSNSILNALTLEQYQAQLASWSKAMSAEADILLYGCETGKGAEGQQFLQKLNYFTSCNVAASSTPVGYAHDGEQWSLEQTSGYISTSVFVAPQAQQDWFHTLATPSDQDFDSEATSVVGNSYTLNGITYTTTSPATNSYTSIQPLSANYAISGSPSDKILIFNNDGGNIDIGAADFRIASSDGSEFKIVSMEADAGIGQGAGTSYTVKGYRDGVEVASDTIDFTSNDVTGSVSYTNNGLGGNGGSLTFDSDWENIDEIRFTGTNVALGIDVLDFSAAVISNTSPSLGGTPADVTATEDVATAINLSAYNISDAESDDPITLTLSVDRGTLAALGGNGTASGVTVAGSGTSSMTLSGAEADLNTFLDNTSNILFTSDTNDTTAATLTVTPNDGTTNGTADTVTINITAVNDDPTVTGLASDITFTEDTQGNVDLSAATFADVDSGNITVTITASEGTFASPADGAGVGSGVVETLVNATTITLVGTASDINTYLDTASNIQWTGVANDTGNDTSTFTVTANDGDGSGDVALGTINADITAVNDDPTATGLPSDLTFTEDTQGNVDLSTVSSADVDSATLTVTLTASEGSFAAPADGAGVGAGVTETLVNSTTITLVGTAADINTYLGTASNIQWTGASNDSGNDASTFSITANDGDGSGNVALGSVNADITAANDAPTLDAGQSPVLTAIDEDAGDDDGSGADNDDDGTNNANNPGTSVADMVVDGSIGDVDGGAVEAIAVTQVDNTNGIWQYSIDNGSSWSNFSATTGSTVDITASARLLDGSLSGASTQLVRFVPNANYNGTANITFHAWDKSSGSAGSTASASATGGATPFSSASDTASVTINAVNDAPIFTGLDGTPSYSEGAAAVQLDADASISDLELDALNGGNGDYSGASLTIVRNGGADAADLFSVLTGGNLTIAGGPNGGGTVTAGGNVIATIANTGDGQLQLSFADNGTTPSTALVNEVLQAIRYSNNSDDLPANVQLDFTVSDGGANDTGSITVNLTDVNDAPSMTATGGNPTFIEGGSAQDLFNTVSTDTIETGQTFSALTLTVTNVSDGSAEILSFDGSDVALTHGNSVTTAANSLSVSVSVAGSTATVSFSGATLTEAQLQTLVDSLTYRNSSDNPTTAGNRVVTITSVTDSGDTANGGNNAATPNLTSTVSLTGVNDAPVVSNVYTETSQVVAGNGAQTLSGFANASVANVDSADYSGGFITLTQTTGTTNGNWSVDGTTVTSGGDAVISANETISVSGTDIGTVDITNDGQGGNTLTINFGANASSTLVQTFLQNLLYDAPSALGNRDFTLTLNDADGTANGGDADDSGSFTISVTPNPPVISNLNSDSVNATEGAGAVLLDAGSNAMLTDADSVDLNGGTVTVSVTASADAASDVLSVDTNGVVSLAGTTAGSNVSVSGTVIGTLVNNIAAGNDFAINLGALSTPALVQSLLRALTFEVTGDTPAESTRTVSITISDGQGSDSADVSVVVTAVNDAPQLSGLISDASFTEDTAANLDLSAVTLSDVDTSGNVTLTLTASAGTLSASSGGGVTIGGSTSAALTLTGTIADIDSYLNGANITHTPGANLAGNDAANVSLSVNDGGINTALGSVNIDITPVNDAPTAADTTESVAYNGTYTFQESDFGFSDVDTGDTLDHITIVSLPTDGVLQYQGQDVNANDQIDALNIGDLTFTPDSGGTGAGYASFTFTVSDGTDDSALAYTVTMDVGARPSTPTTPTTPTTTSEQVDGVDVTTTEEQDEDGNTIQTVTVTPVTSTREDSDDTTDDADIPLHYANGNTNQVVTTVSLPTGVGVTTRSNTTASTQNKLENLIALIDDSAEDEEDLNEMENSGNTFLEALESTENLWVNQIELTSDGTSSTSEAIKITGSSDSTYQEALVIDTRNLPAGTVLDLNDIEFAVIVGTNVTIRGGEGANIVYAGANAQNIVLGAEDDELHGGAGDDVVGSKGGDDLLYGDSGNDTVIGGVGNDTLSGGVGDDLLQGSQQDNGQLVFSLNSAGEITTLYTPEELDLSDSALDTIEFTGDWYSQASYVYEGQAFAQDMSASIDSLLQASDDFALVGVDSTRLKTLAILKKVFDGELYTVDALNEAATSDTTLLEYATQAVIDWREQANISATDATEDQVWSLLKTFWRFLDINRDDINEAVSYIDDGGSWEALLLDVIADDNSNYLLYGGTGVMQLAQATDVSNSGLQEDIGDDDLAGGAGNDTLVGGHGSDRLDGGDGDDLAIQSRSTEDYQFTLTSAGELALVYQDDAYVETDTLVDIEQVEFSDATLDFFASNLSSSVLVQLGTLGQLMTGNAPSLEQLNAYQSDQLSLTGLASALMQTEAYQEQWQALDDASFITTLAAQVVDEPFTQNDISYWVARLDTDLNREDVFILAAGVESYQTEALENGLILM